MDSAAAKSLPTLGFLTVVEHPQFGLFGGYLILNGLPPLIDGRFDPYLGTGPGGRSLAEGYVDVEALRSDPHDFMKALGVDYALLARGPFSQALLHDPAFTVVESDLRHLVFKVGPFD